MEINYEEPVTRMVLVVEGRGCSALLWKFDSIRSAPDQRLEYLDLNSGSPFGRFVDALVHRFA